MKVFAAAVAAVVIAGLSFSSAPAFASGGAVLPSAVAVAATDAPPPTLGSALPTPPHPLVLPDPAPAAAQAQVQGKVAESSTASIMGQVTSVYSAGELLANVKVRAVLFDSVDHSIKFERDATTDSLGQYTITGLAPASYWLEFHDSTNYAGTTFQWWGSSLMNPFGQSVPVTDGEAHTANWALTPAGTVSGKVTLEGSTSPPSPSEASIVFGVFASTNDFTPVASIAPEADGSYNTSFLYPADQYVTFIDFTGSNAYTRTSNSFVYGVSNSVPAVADVIISRQLTPIAGVRGSINSVVNALYWDFLNRLPGTSDVVFWNNQFINGSGPSAVTAGFVNSDEYRLIRIDSAYQRILGRGPDAGGRANWLRSMQQGVITTDDIETSFYASQEYYLQHGGTDTKFMGAIYQTLLHRDGSSADFAFWSKLIEQHGREWVIAQFWDSTETISERVSLMYQAYLGRVPDPEGLQNWVNLALQIGDSGLRSGFTASDEYFVRSQFRFSERTDSGD